MKLLFILYMTCFIIKSILSMAYLFLYLHYFLNKANCQTLQEKKIKTTSNLTEGVSY